MMQGGNSRNNQHNLGVSSKTHTESMIYSKAQNQRSGNESSAKQITNLSGSFNNGLSSSMIGMQNTTALNARGTHG